MPKRSYVAEDRDEDSYLTGDEKLLHEIRTRFDYTVDMWKDIRAQAKIDMDYVSGNPWPESEKKKRQEAGRPFLVMDEISQYTNSLVNDIRQNKRAVKVVPRGLGANDQTAENRGNLIREIEYKSNAQSAYATGFENVIHRSYGGWRIVRRYVDDKSFDQELRVVRIPNPDASYPDFDCKESDFSDARYWFLLDLVPRKEYKNRWPKAKITDFNGDHIKTAPNWIKEDQIQIAEYWRVEEEERELVQVRGDKKNIITLFKDDLPTPAKGKRGPKILDSRMVKQRRIMQYITNGVEILERNEEPGKYIPIIWFTGKELYVSSDNGPKRMLMSMIRLARDPQMMVNYLRTCEAELVGMTPKTPYIGIVGQFENPEDWQNIAHDPKGFLTYRAKTEDTGEEILPPPARQPYVPAVEPIEAAAEAARRGVQSAMGLSALPTNAQRLNDKSGVALKQIDANEDRGSFHFIDNYEMALEHSGRVLNNLIPFVYDGAREVGIRKQDDTHSTLKINQPYTDEKGQPAMNDMTVGEHEVTISTGPSFQSERDAADEFVEVMIPQLEAMPLDPTVKTRLLAMLIKLKNVGPTGDEMIKILSPDQSEQQQQQALQQAQQQNQTYQQLIASLQAETQKLYAEKNGKVVDNQFAVKMKQMELDQKTSEADKDRLTRLEVAQITAKAQDQQQRDQLWADLLHKLHDSAHEVAMQAVEHAHAASQQQDAQDAAAQQAAAAQQQEGADQTATA